MYKRNYIHKMIAGFASDDQNRTALALYDGKQITEISYRGLAREILSAAGFFQKNGLIGRHIALLSENCREWIVAYIGIVASGNVAVPLNPALPRETILAQCAFADVTVICGDQQDIADYSGDYRCVSYGLLSGEEPVRLEDIACPERDETMMLLFTSGTTGDSKAVEITYSNMESSLMSEDRVFAEPGINRIMMVLPMFHIAGIRGALAMLCRYKTLCIGRGVKYLFRDMPVLSPDYISLVPLMVDSLIKIVKRTSWENMEKNYLGSNLKRICVGGASVDPESCRYLAQEGFSVDIAYALSETTGVGTWGKWDERHPDTIGKLSEALRCRVVDGELQFKGGTVMKGYYKDPEGTGSALADGWLRTGDLGYCDENGNLYLTGRKKNIIVMPNGEKLNPETVERYFIGCDAIVDCLIRLGDDDKVLCLEVFAKDKEKVRDFVEKYNEKMPLSYNIRKIVYHDKPLERTTSGKLIRKER